MRLSQNRPTKKTDWVVRTGCPVCLIYSGLLCCAELITSLKNAPYATAGSITVNQWLVQWRNSYKVPSGLILHAKTLLMPVLALADAGSFSAQKRISISFVKNRIKSLFLFLPSHLLYLMYLLYNEAKIFRVGGIRKWKRTP